MKNKMILDTIQLELSLKRLKGLKNTPDAEIIKFKEILLFSAAMSKLQKTISDFLMELEFSIRKHNKNNRR